MPHSQPQTEIQEQLEYLLELRESKGYRLWQERAQALEAQSQRLLEQEALPHLVYRYQGEVLAFRKASALLDVEIKALKQKVT